MLEKSVSIFCTPDISSASRKDLSTLHRILYLTSTMIYHPRTRYQARKMNLSIEILQYTQTVFQQILPDVVLA